MRSIFRAGWGLVISLALGGCADLLGIEEWKDSGGAGAGGQRSASSADSGGGEDGGSGSGGTILGPCFNGVQDGAETGVDCGGPDCGDCTIGGGCALDGDCASGYCSDERGYCLPADGRDTCGTPDPDNTSCADCIQNGAETDVDCGGECGECRPGQKCTNDGECTSWHCTSGFCDKGDKGATCYSNVDCVSNSCGKLGCTNGKSCCQ